MRERRLLGRGLLVLAIAGSLALATTAALAQGHAASPANGRAGSKSVSATGSAWSPSSLTVSRGTRVTWKNPTSEVHNVVAYGGTWTFNKTITAGHSVGFGFSNAGTFLFRCTLHSYVSGGVCHGMCGRVVVRT